MKLKQKVFPSSLLPFGTARWLTYYSLDLFIWRVEMGRIIHLLALLFSTWSVSSSTLRRTQLLNSKTPYNDRIAFTQQGDFMPGPNMMKMAHPTGYVPDFIYLVTRYVLRTDCECSAGGAFSSCDVLLPTEPLIACIPLCHADMGLGTRLNPR